MKLKYTKVNTFVLGISGAINILLCVLLAIYWLNNPDATYTTVITEDLSFKENCDCWTGALANENSIVNYEIVCTPEEMD